jgi:UDP-glucose 4-epimerase
MARVLITGGAGFIGVHMVRHLQEKGLEVRTLDLSKPPIEGIEKLTGSILDINDVNQAVRGCDYVIHLAAMLGVRRTQIMKMEALNINIQGTINILEACVKEKVKKIVFTSSSEVYGRQVTFPTSEESPVSPLSTYAVSKLIGEEYVKAFQHNYGLKYSIVRLFNVYGPRQVAEFVIPRFIKAVMENKSPLIYGTGEQVRSFCYVSDAVRGIALVLLREGTDSKIFNIGNDANPISMKDLASKVISIAKKDIKLRFIAVEETGRDKDKEIPERVPDISKARKVLSYEPEVSLQEGIIKVMDYGFIEETWFDPMKQRMGTETVFHK